MMTTFGDDDNDVDNDDNIEFHDDPDNHKSSQDPRFSIALTNLMNIIVYSWKNDHRMQSEIRRRLDELGCHDVRNFILLNLEDIQGPSYGSLMVAVDRYLRVGAYCSWLDAVNRDLHFRHWIELAWIYTRWRFRQNENVHSIVRWNYSQFRDWLDWNLHRFSVQTVDAAKLLPKESIIIKTKKKDPINTLIQLCYDNNKLYG